MKTRSKNNISIIIHDSIQAIIFIICLILFPIILYNEKYSNNLGILLIYSVLIVISNIYTKAVGYMMKTLEIENG